MFVYEAAALGAAALWALTGLISAGPAQHLGAIAFNCTRMVLVALMLIAWVAITTGWGSISADHIVPLMLSGVIGIFMGDTALFLTLNRMGPRRTAMLFSLNAPMSAILGWLLLNEDLTVTQILGILITFSGVLLAIRFGKRKSQLHQWESIRGPLWAGVLLGLAAALSQSIGSSDRPAGDGNRRRSGCRLQPSGRHGCALPSGIDPPSGLLGETGRPVYPVPRWPDRALRFSRHGRRHDADPVRAVRR
jgi:drug/metabolite transporter (DMT)-like permease